MRIGLELHNDSRLMLWRPVDRALFSIGSNFDCDLCIPHSGVAPVQAVLRSHGGMFTLVNQAAAGAVVGDELVLAELRLGHGDILRLGSLTATVCFVEEPVDETRGGVTQTLVPQGAPPGKPRAFFVTVPEDFPGKRWGIDEQGVTFGKDSANDVVLADPYVSSFHLRLYVDGGRCMARDLGSRNGVFVGDLKVLQGEVHPGTQIRIGETILMVSAPSFSTSAANTSVREWHAPGLLGNSPAMARVRHMVRRMAVHQAPVLITGETGTGKEVVARLLAELSPQASGPFVALNCGSLGRNLIESELFGHERGAFTGAIARKLGAFEAAHKGTLFLDEIGELPLELQPHLLRVLETGEVRRVGGTETVRVDVRVVAATNRKLAMEVAEKKFREDLFHRLHVLVLELPPLRERGEDLGELAEHFVRLFAPEGVKLHLTPQALKKLLDYPWPGNVRELRNVLQRAVLMRLEDDAVGAQDIEFMPTTQPPEAPSQGHTAPTLVDMERQAIITALVRHHGNRTEAAQALGVSRSTMHRRIDEFRIDVDAILKAVR